jgi:hypothetical protein
MLQFFDEILMLRRRHSLLNHILNHIEHFREVSIQQRLNVEPQAREDAAAVDAIIAGQMRELTAVKNGPMIARPEARSDQMTWRNLGKMAKIPVGRRKYGPENATKRVGIAYGCSGAP